MELHVVFISIPMSGLDMKTVLINLENARAEYRRRHEHYDKQLLFVDNYACPNPPPDSEYDGVWYLGNALQIMSRCNEVFFFGEWREARGCMIEHEVCEKYGIPYTEV